MLWLVGDVCGARFWLVYFKAVWQPAGLQSTLKYISNEQINKKHFKLDNGNESWVISDQHFVVLHFQPPLHSVATIRWLLLKFVKSLNHHNKLNVYSQVASWQRWFWVILGFDSRFSCGFSAFPHLDVIIIIALTSLLHLFCAWKQAVRALLQLFLLVLFSFVTILTQNFTKWPVSLNLSDRKSHLNNRKYLSWLILQFRNMVEHFFRITNRYFQDCSLQPSVTNVFLWNEFVVWLNIIIQVPSFGLRHRIWNRCVFSTVQGQEIPTLKCTNALLALHIWTIHS